MTVMFFFLVVAVVWAILLCFSCVNDSNRRSSERVGIQHDSVAESSSAISCDDKVKTYADTPYNRETGRVGMPHGSMIVRRSEISCDDKVKTYADNPYNRKSGRVGMPVGNYVVSRPRVRCVEEVEQNDFSLLQVILDFICSFFKYLFNINDSAADTGNAEERPMEKDMPRNIVSKNVYVDNAINRHLGRVGQPRGSKPAVRNQENITALDENYPDIQGEQSLA